MDQLTGIWEEEVWAMPERIFFYDLSILTMNANPAVWKIYLLFAVQLESNMYGGRGTESSDERPSNTGWEAHTISEEEPLFTQFLQRVPHNF